MTYPGSQSVSYSYDNENRLQSATENGNTSSFLYDANNRKIQETLANGVIVSYQYDSKGRLTSITHIKDGITIASAAYTYDSTVNPLSMTSTEGQTSYQYDDIYELTNVSYPDNSTESFTYDSAGNRTSLNGISYVYDTANRLLQAGTDLYTYDQNGNRITENAKQYQYDWNNRLTSITSGDESTQFTYDGDGSRTSQQKIVSGATIEASSYIYDPSQGIPRLLQEEIVSGPTLSYVYAGRLLEQTGSSNGTMFYHQDAIGNTLAMTDMTGAAVNTYRYDAFGASELISGTVPNNRQFTGHVSDSTGLIYMNARYYDPATGRFLTQDTVPGRPMDPLSYNLYAYCKNNPVAYTDPSGHLSLCEIQETFTGIIDATDDNLFFGLVLDNFEAYQEYTEEIERDNQNYCQGRLAADVGSVVYGSVLAGQGLAMMTNGTIGTGLLLATGFGDFLVPVPATIVAVGTLETAYGITIGKKGFENLQEDWGLYEARKNDQSGTDKQINGTPGNNQAQNKQVDSIVKQYGLNKDERRMLHEEITGQNYSYKEIEQIAKDIKGIEE